MTFPSNFASYFVPKPLNGLLALFPTRQNDQNHSLDTHQNNQPNKHPVIHIIHMDFNRIFHNHKNKFHLNHHNHLKTIHITHMDNMDSNNHNNKNNHNNNKKLNLKKIMVIQHLQKVN